MPKHDNIDSRETYELTKKPETRSRQELEAEVARLKAQLATPKPAAKPVKYSELPLISVMAQEDMDRAKELLAEFDSTKDCLKTLQSEEERIGKELAELQRKYGLEGLRYGGLAFKVSTQPGRVTLKEAKLIEAGVSAALIDKCKEQGKPFDMMKLERLKSEE